MDTTEYFSDTTITNFTPLVSKSTSPAASTYTSGGVAADVALTAIRAQYTQSRANINDDTVEEYAELLANGVTLPPITLFGDGDIYWIGDGFHRYHAAVNTGAKTISCVVHPGGQREALKYSLGANTTHGLRRTNADKRRAVEIALNDEEWGQWTNRGIADLCEVSHIFVGKVREECQVETVSTSTLPMPDVRLGRDGKNYPATKAAQPGRISGGITFDIAEIEAAAGKPPKNGAPINDGGSLELERARGNVSNLIRNCHALGIFDELNRPLSEVTRRLDQLRKERFGSLEKEKAQQPESGATEQDALKEIAEHDCGF